MYNKWLYQYDNSFYSAVDERTLAKILKRYSDFDQSEKGANGLTLSNVLAIPEFVGFALVTYVAKIYMNKDNEKMFPQDFIYFISALSSKSSIEFKQDCKLITYSMKIKI